MRHVLPCLLAAFALSGCPESGQTQKADVDPTAANAISGAVRAKIRGNLGNMKRACDQYMTKHGSYPSAAEQLIEANLVSEEAATDPWGAYFVIEEAAGSVRVVTYGADGAPGGEGRDADFSTD